MGLGTAYIFQSTPKGHSEKSTARGGKTIPPLLEAAVKRARNSATYSSA